MYAAVYKADGRAYLYAVDLLAVNARVAVCACAAVFDLREPTAAPEMNAIINIAVFGIDFKPFHRLSKVARVVLAVFYLREPMAPRVCGIPQIARAGGLRRARLGCRLCRCARRTKLCVDLGGNIGVMIIEVRARTRFIIKIAVYRHVCAVEMVHAGVFVRAPYELFDAVAFANVRDEVDKRRVRFARHGVRLRHIGCHLNRYGAVIVLGRRAAPRAVALLHVHTYTPIVADAVIGGGITIRIGKDVSERLHAHLSNHAMDRDCINRVVSGAVSVGRDTSVIYKCAVCVCHLVLISLVVRELFQSFFVQFVFLRFLHVFHSASSSLS